jgi:hypothetical protein
VNAAALLAKLESAAREAGRFRRRVQDDPELSRFRHLADRLAGELEWALAMVEPTAGELTAWTYPGEPEAAAAAIDAVDARAVEVRRLLGDRSRR